MADNCREVADLLRRKRASVTPADVGLPEGVRRRTPGLRREEVAALASISTTYYAYLEQARPMRPSVQVLTALAAALRMSPGETRLLIDLAHPTAGPRPSELVERVDPMIVDVLARLEPDPAYVTGRTWDVLAANRSARLLWTDWTVLPGLERNMLWFLFVDPIARERFVEWEVEARALLGRFRVAHSRNQDDPQFADLLRRLLDASPEARRWWPKHEVAPIGGGEKSMRHPAVGTVRLHHTVLTVADEPDQKVVLFTVDDTHRARVGELIRAM